ncbi:hypothetical protein [Hymenobacter siberiensis]|uniref:hypothetical protein n=1 Tax=Hymenobacter siberiensis TaxID=2848396 RepID=UPI001C1E469A|nr:hypothetical protein [Hymenobacter siberiensis]
MKYFFTLLVLGSASYTFEAGAQDLANAGATITLQAGATLYVGTGGLRNQAGTLTNAGILRVDGPLTTPGTLPLSTGALEVKGDFANTGTLLPSTSALTFSGTANQVLPPRRGHPLPSERVLVTTGRKITISHKALFVSAICKRIEKHWFYEENSDWLKSELKRHCMRLLLPSHESMSHLRLA